MSQIDWQEWERVRALQSQSPQAYWRDMGEKAMAEGRTTQRLEHLGYGVAEDMEKRIKAATSLDELRSIMRQLPSHANQDGHELADMALCRALELMVGYTALQSMPTWVAGFIADYNDVGKWYA